MGISPVGNAGPRKRFYPAYGNAARWVGSPNKKIYRMRRQMSDFTSRIIVGENRIGESLMEKIIVMTDLMSKDFKGSMDVMLGGSHRFGYHNRAPNDIDLFICCEAEDLSRFVEKWGLREEEFVDYHPADRQIKGVAILSERYDLSFFHSQIHFDEIVRIHQRIDALLNENDGLLRDMLKTFDMKGVSKFNKLWFLLNERGRATLGGVEVPVVGV